VIVDASGGGQFTRIQDAIDAAQDGDVILVRPGSYEKFVMTKGVTVRAASVPVQVTHPCGAPPPFETILISNIGGGQRAALAGIEFIPQACSLISLEVANCAGEVLLEDITVDCSGGCAQTPDLSIRNSTNVSINDLTFRSTRVSVQDSAVRLTDVELRGEDGLDGVNLEFANDGGRGGAALRVIRSQVVLVRPDLVGGEGGDGVDCDVCTPACGAGGQGGEGVLTQLAGSDIIVMGSSTDTITGGKGGNACDALGNFRGRGGHGVDVASNDAVTILSQVTLQGGAQGDTGLVNPTQGDPSVGLVTSDPNLPTLSMSGSLTPGTSVTADLQATEMGVVLFLNSDLSGFFELPGFSGPPLSVLPGNFFNVLNVGGTSPSGQFGVTSPLPLDNSLQGFPLHLQAAFFGQSGDTYLSNAVTRIIGE
jgi:hypothetical protein